MYSTQRRSRGTSNRSASTVSPNAVLTTNPPSRAAPTLSGWPSIAAAILSMSGGARLPSASAFAATMPATVAAADEPSPRSNGIRLRIVDPPADALGDLAAEGHERRLEGCDEAVVAVLGQLVDALAVDVELDLAAAPAPDLDLDPVDQVEGHAQAVIARPEVRGRRGDFHGDPAPVELGQPVRDHPSAAARYQPTRRRSASVVGRHRGCRRPGSPRCAGSFRPLPVRTQTTVASGARSSPAAASAGCPARLAADDGSQKTPSCRGEVAVGGQDLVVGDGLDPAAGLVAGRDRLRPAAGLPIRIAVAIVSGSVDRVADHERCGAGRLEAEHPRRRPDVRPAAAVVAEPGPIGADVAGVADRDRQDVGRPAEVVADLEGGGLLARRAGAG